MSVLPLADARARLSELVTEAERTHERYEITRNGRAAAVLLSADDYESMRETISVLSDRELMADLTTGLAELRAGEGLDGAQLKVYLDDSWSGRE